MSKVKKLLFLFLAIVLIAPIGVSAFTEGASSYSRAYAVKKDSQATNSSVTSLYEIWLVDPDSFSHLEKYRAYCMDEGKNVPTEKITKSSTVWEGPACSLTRYPDTSDPVQLHSRIKYIHNFVDSTSSCNFYKKVSGNCSSGATKAVDDGSTISVSSSNNFVENGDYYVAEATIAKTGSITSYTPTLRSSVSGAIVTEDINSTTNVDTSSANLLYIKIPKSGVSNASSIDATLTASAQYVTRCNYQVPGLIKYTPSQGTSSYQRIGYPTWKNGTATKTFTKSSNSTYNISGVLVNKYDANSYLPLENVKFGIYSDSSCTNAITDEFDDAKVAFTDQYGEASFTVDEGTYYVKELQSISGYEKSDECKQVASGSSVTFYDRLLGGVKIKKIDGKTNEPMQGVKFDLYKEDKVTKAVYTTGVQVGELTTDENGEISLSNLPYGVYYLKETYAPSTYTSLDEFVEVDVSSNSSVLTLENYPIELEVVKKDIVTEEILEGAQFQIIDSTGEVVNEFTTTNEYTYLVLEPGDYKLVESSSPEGYVNSGLEIEFNIATDGVVSITSEENQHYQLIGGAAIVVYNDEEVITPDVPKTGAATGPIIIVLGIVSIGIGGYFIYDLKKKQALEK